MAPFVAVVLIVTAASQTSPRLSARSTTLVRPVRDTSTQSVASPTTRLGTATAAQSTPGTSPADRGATNASSSPADISSWLTANADLLDELDTDVTNVDADATNGELPSLQGDCARLQTDLEVAQNIPPVPDPSEDSTWNQALGDFAWAIGQCVSGIDDHNSSAIAEATDETNSGEKMLVALTNQTKTHAQG